MIHEATKSISETKDIILTNSELQSFENECKCGNVRAQLVNIVYQ